MTELLDISDLDKADVLAALYNAASPLGYGFIQAGRGPLDMDHAFAARLIETGQAGTPDYDYNQLGSRRLYFDYVYGRPLKIDLAEDVINIQSYDNDHGAGKAQEVIAHLRKTGSVLRPDGSSFGTDPMTDEQSQLFLASLADWNRRNSSGGTGEEEEDEDEM